MGVDQFDLAAFVAASCKRHGVALKVADAGVQSQVALLLSGRAVRGAAQRDPDVRTESDPPDEIDPVGVEHATPNFGRCDHDMVQNGPHDGVLAGEIEIGPLSA